jgi:hypothetical protein
MVANLNQIPTECESDAIHIYIAIHSLCEFTFLYDIGLNLLKIKINVSIFQLNLCETGRPHAGLLGITLNCPAGHMQNKYFLLHTSLEMTS